MKKYFFSLVLFLLCAVVPISASEISNAKHNLNSAQREFSQITSKCDRAQQKQAQLQAEYEKALNQMNKSQDKPESLTYKNALKKKETIEAKMEQNALDVARLKSQADSLSQVVIVCEKALQDAEKAKSDEKQAKEDEKRAQQQAREEEKLAKKQAREEERLAKQQAREEKNSPKQHEIIEEEEAPIIYDSRTESPQKDEASNQNEKTTAENNEESSDTLLWIIVLLVVLYVMYKIIKWVRWRKCPNCKKRWALKVIDEQDMGTVKKSKEKNADGTHDWVYYRKIKVTRECKYCGHQVWHTEVRREG